MLLSSQMTLKSDFPQKIHLHNSDFENTKSTLPSRKSNKTKSQVNHNNHRITRYLQEKSLLLYKVNQALALLRTLLANNQPILPSLLVQLKLTSLKSLKFKLKEKSSVQNP